jgi:hypothetical protein
MGVLLGLAGDLAAPRLPRDMVASAAARQASAKSVQACVTA